MFLRFRSVLYILRRIMQQQHYSEECGGRHCRGGQSTVLTSSTEGSRICPGETISTLSCSSPNPSAQSTNVFISAYDQPVKYRRYKIFFSYETLQMIMNVRVNVQTFATNIVVYLKHDSCNPTQVFFTKPDIPDMFILKR